MNSSLNDAGDGPTATSHWDDSALVEAAQRGDAEAFGILVDRYHAQIYSLTARMCDRQQAEDLTQDIFVKALTALREFRFRGEASFKTWLYRIAINEAINELRRHKRHRQLVAASLDEPVPAEDGYVTRQLGDTTNEPHRRAVQHALQEAVCEVLGMLTPKQRAALVLVDIEGLSYQEAAQALECPLGTLKSRLVRARSAFAEKFREHQPEWAWAGAALIG